MAPLQLATEPLCAICKCNGRISASFAEGELQVVFGPAEQQSAERAARDAKGLAGKHAGVIA